MNKTGKTDFEVVVFTKNFSTNTPQTYYCAWQILRGQTSIKFVYPVSTAIGATYKERGQEISAGPFPAELGTTWTVSQESDESTAVLEEGTTSILE